MNKNELVLEIIKIYRELISWKYYDSSSAVFFQEIINKLLDQLEGGGNEHGNLCDDNFFTIMGDYRSDYWA